MNLALAVFSNCTNDCLENPTVYDTMASLGFTFKDSYKIKSLTVYVDPNPNPGYYKKYVERLKELGFYVVKTSSLSSGWLKAIDNAVENDIDYLFMLEHDWTFDTDVVKHTLQDITFRMAKDNLGCMLFNKHKNDDSLNGSKWQTYLKSTKSFYCMTDRFSNNPNILNVKWFKDNYMDRVNWNLAGAGRIEQSLEKKVNIAVYGEYGSEPAIIHLDGRKGGQK